VITFGSDGLTGHPDHIAVARAVRIAIELEGFPGCGALGAALRPVDVDSDHIRLRGIAPTATMASGRVEGSKATLISVDVSAAADRRRWALDS
jgi:LmbE family N-acetylglucosaminyl deacetylase